MYTPRFHINLDPAHLRTLLKYGPLPSATEKRAGLKRLNGI